MKTSIKIAGFSYFIIINMVYEYGVSVTGSNIALRAGKQPIKNVIARHYELTRFDYWYCFFISAVK
ncbi:hypothetical protein BY43_03605 [Escherichia coli O25:NM str. E2539C1]|nr:hypothetical protein BY43_03605 [Escherichia coli O25:NM str. E2539C1]EZC18124.1 hypothetical protein BY74_22115 [Escherichia coli O157:H7 str. K2845]KTP08766.1 hypothetical protein IN84_19015 [Salmonella enterica]MCH6702004.1 hypothetical protein [Escherichia coli]OCE39775.1 hypothetical protein AW005_09090 [Shigella sonnei]